MSDVDVPPRARVRLGQVDGDLRVGAGATLEADGTGPIRVSGSVDIRGDATIAAPIECGRIRMRDGRLTAAGSVTVHGDVDADDSDVEITGAFQAADVDVDRRLELKGPAKVQDLEVGGALRA
jgi:cytoskeletal protein CcmA (bactofilin family)